MDPLIIYLVSPLRRYTLGNNYLLVTHALVDPRSSSLGVVSYRFSLLNVVVFIFSVDGINNLKQA